MTECYAGIPDEVLDSTWLDSDLARLSRNVVSWEELAPFWGLTEAEEEEIKRDNHSYAAQKLAALRRWKAKCSKTATYRQVVRLFTRMGKLELVEKVREIVLIPEEVSTGGTGNVLSYYREFLEMSYQQLPQPAVLFNQWPVMSSYCVLPLVGNQAIKPCVGDHCILVAHPAFYHLLSNRSMKIKKMNLKNRRYTFHSSSVALVVALLSKACQDLAKLLSCGILANSGLSGSYSNTSRFFFRFHFVAPEYSMPRA